MIYFYYHFKRISKNEINKPKRINLLLKYKIIIISFLQKLVKYLIHSRLIQLIIQIKDKVKNKIEA